MCLSTTQARKRHTNINCFVWLALGRPRVGAGDFTGLVPGTNPVKTWDKPGFSPYFTQRKPGKPGFVSGTNPVCPWDNPRDEGRHRKFMRKKFMCLFRSLSTYGLSLTGRGHVILCLARVPGTSHLSAHEPLLVAQNQQYHRYLTVALSRIVTRKHLSGPVLRDTARLSQRYPPIARYGVFGVSTWPIGCDTPSPFSEHFPFGEYAKWRCDTPPSKGYPSDTCAIPFENKANGCDTPRLQYYLERVLRDMGGISHWAAKANIGQAPHVEIK